MVLQAILDDCGLSIQRFEPVHGGDINYSYRLHGPGVNYFLKVNDARRYPGMFEKEARGLDALSSGMAVLERSAALKVPRVIKYGVIQQEQYLVLEWLEPGR